MFRVHTFEGGRQCNQWQAKNNQNSHAPTHLASGADGPTEMRFAQTAGTTKFTSESQEEVTQGNGE